VLADARPRYSPSSLGGGMLFGWSFLDPVMGIVALVDRRSVARQPPACGAEDHGHVEEEVRRVIATLTDHEIADLHVWRIGPASRACILSVVSHTPLAVEAYRQKLSVIHGLDHITIEINHCRDNGCRTQI
jgi:Co/Zn/Cd efflux system component